MMTGINVKNYQICYRCGVINDFIIRSPKPLGPFNRFDYFRLVYVYSIFRFCRSSLFRGKRRKVGYINSVCYNDSNLFQISFYNLCQRLRL